MVLSIGYCIQAATGFNGQLLKIHGYLRYTLMVDMIAVALNVSLNLFDRRSARSALRSGRRAR